MAKKQFTSYTRTFVDDDNNEILEFSVSKDGFYIRVSGKSTNEIKQSFVLSLDHLDSFMELSDNEEFREIVTTITDEADCEEAEKKRRFGL